jgi:hypothetical protein
MLVSLHPGIPICIPSDIRADDDDDDQAKVCRSSLLGGPHRVRITRQGSSGFAASMIPALSGRTFPVTRAANAPTP